MKITDAKDDVTACEFDVDIMTLENVIDYASPWVDIQEVVMETDASSLYGIIRVAGPIAREVPQDHSDAIAAHVAIDTDRDGDVDYGIDVGSKNNDGATGLLTDYDTMTSYGQEDGEFPGVVEMTGNEFRFKIPLSAIGNAETFDWFALAYWMLVKGPIESPDEMMLELADIYPLGIQCPYNESDNFAEFPSGNLNLRAEEPLISVAMKQKNKLTLLSIKNNSEIPIFGIGLHSNDGSIKYVKAKGWEREKVDPSTILIQTFQQPVTGQKSMVILLILDSKYPSLEWAAFDIDGSGILAGSIPEHDESLPSI
jgi:hypothetical protein